MLTIPPKELPAAFNTQASVLKRPHAAASLSFEGRFTADEDRLKGQKPKTGIRALPGKTAQSAQGIPMSSVADYFPFNLFSKKQPKELTYTAHLDTTLSTLKNYFIKVRIKQFFGFKPVPKTESEVLFNKLWKNVFEPLVNDPIKGEAIITAWEQDLEKNQEASLLRDVGLMGLKHFKKNINKPEALKKAVNLFTIVMTAEGGYKKLNHLVGIARSEEFKKSDQIRRGQMILEGTGPIFIKAFQTVSTIPNLFSPAIQNSMTRLYEDITPVPLEQLNKIFQEELGVPLEKAYDVFDPKPLKVGSIAQVHKAKLFGNDVVVKIVKPGVVESLKGDLELLRPLVELGQLMMPEFEIQDLFNDFADKMINETNMTRQLPGEPEGEAERLKGMKEALKDCPDVIVPGVIDSHTRKRVLTMEFVPGQSMSNFKGNPIVARGYLTLLMDQIFSYGYCQADPHPGNVLFNPFTSKYGCIDAGLAYMVPKQERIDFAKILIAMFSRNADMMADAILKEGGSKKPEYKEFKDQLDKICPSQDNMDYKSTLKFLTEATKLAHKSGMEIRMVNPLLWKTLFTAVSVAKTIDPSVNIGFPTVSRLAFLFLKNNNAGYMASTAYTMGKDQVVRGLGGLRKWWDDLAGGGDKK